MKHLLNLFIILNALKLVRLFSTDNNDKSFTDDESKNDSTSDKVNDLRDARIFWPYPVNKSDLLVNQGRVSEPSDSQYQDQRNGTIKPRFLGYWTYPQNPIIDLMMHTAPVNYAPASNNDPFDFLRDSYPTPKGSSSREEYDYVVVGGGSAGAVLAARLSAEQPRAAVLVLEAGRPEMILSDVPAMAQYLQQTDYVWPYSMEHQPGVCMGSEEQRCYSPRGRALGGHSVTNSMLYARGRPHDWDSIAADGNYGWSHNEVLPYFMKSERAELKKYKNATYHGRAGEITVENVPFKTGLVEAFLAAGREFGHPTIDYNSPDQLGFGYVQTMTTKGHRMSTAKAFLHPNKRRKNLHILTEATVTKVIIEPQSKRAYAVEYIINNEKHTASFRREVILSAGPIASAQLLLLSGIGPRESLGNLGIPVISDVKVGRSLYDHISFPGVVFKLNSTNASLLEPKVATLSNMMQWLQFGDGLLTTPGGIEGVGYLKMPLSKQVESVPDIELLSMGGSLTYDSGGAIRKSWRISDKTYHHAFGSLSGLDTWQAIPVLLHPKSKGYLELRDTNPFSHPKLFGNYLSDPEDLATLKEAVKYIIKLGESEPFKKYGAKLHLAPYPTCSVHPLGSESYWECAIKTMTVSLRRQVGTCKMGPSTDHDAVVDPELRVYGVDGIRVADSSVIPRTISSDTTAAEIMIAEKAADMIKKTWANVVAK